MFIHMLDLDQRVALLRASSTLAEIDGAHPERERELLEALNVEAGLDEVPPQAVGPDELFRAIDAAYGDQPTARNVLILELAGVTVIDGDASADEVAFISEIARRLGGDTTLVTKAIEVAESALHLAQDARTFIATEDS
jgi:tellurite resistance protein